MLIVVAPHPNVNDEEKRSFETLIPDLLHRLFPRGRVPHLRPRRPRLLRDGTGGQARPDGQGVPQGDEVHLLQVRSLWHGRKERRTLRVAAQHHQREDLHLHMVKVHL